MANAKAVSTSSRAVSKIDEQIRKLRNTNSGRDVTKKIAAIKNSSSVSKVSNKKSEVGTTVRKTTTKNSSSAVKSSMQKKKSVNVIGGKTRDLASTKKVVDASKDDSMTDNFLEQTIKIGHLEEQIRKLYSSPLEDDHLEKTIVRSNKLSVSDSKLKKINEKKTFLDKISISSLDKILLVVFSIFLVLFAAFVAFAIFVSTF